MRLSVSLLLALGAVIGASGCGPEPPCVNEEGDELNFCQVKFEDQPEPVLFCPGEHWGAEDGCNSCGCDNAGEVQCTAVECVPE